MTDTETYSAPLPKLILASASPRRREILTATGIEFEALPTSIPEHQRKGESPRKFVSRLATEKARAAQLMLRAWTDRSILPPTLFPPILGADTVVVLGNQIFGKPVSPADARRMLRALSGREHKVLTGVCLLYPSRKRSSSWLKEIRVVSTTVKFCRLSSKEIEEYAATDEPLDKAGAYAIQGRASKYVDWIDGCYFNVVGLPVSVLYRMLKKVSRSNNGSL